MSSKKILFYFFRNKYIYINLKAGKSPCLALLPGKSISKFHLIKSINHWVRLGCLIRWMIVVDFSSLYPGRRCFTDNVATLLSEVAIHFQHLKGKVATDPFTEIQPRNHYTLYIIREYSLLEVVWCGR